MKIFLANPLYKYGISPRLERYYVRAGSRWPHSGVKLRGRLPHYLPFPFSLAYGAALLMRAGFEVRVMDAVALDAGEDALLQEIGRERPDMVFFEMTTPTADYDAALAAKIKAVCGAVVVLAGAHAGLFAERILTGQRGVDFIIKGEYEWTLLRLAESLCAGRGDFPQGTVFLKDARPVDAGPPPAPLPLDGLPFPSRDLFPSNALRNPTRYWDGFCQHRPLLYMQSSRGCPYRCCFCLGGQASYPGIYRVFSAERVADEMREASVRYAVREVYFDDDNFTADKGRVASLCEEFLRSGLGVKWSCTGDVICLDGPTLKLMARSGCVGIKFGVESGSPRLLKTIGKPLVLPQVREAVHRCRGLGIKTHAAFTVGLPGETEEDIAATAAFAYALDADSVQISTAVPLPGTAFYETVKGLLAPATSWSAFDGKLRPVARRRQASRAEAQKTRKKIFATWFFRKAVSPLWLLRHARVLARTLRGVGAGFLCGQVLDVAIDEWKNN